MAAGWFMVAAIIWLSLMPSPPDPGIEHADKLEHVLAYAMLMFWFCQLHAGWRTRLAYAIGFVAMGVGLEFVQGALAHRTYEAFDMLANGLGVAMGWMVAQASGTRVFARIERLIGV
jgi:VanZ family protein